MYCNLRRSKPTILLVSFVFILAASVSAQKSTGTSQGVAPVIFLDSTKDQDGLVGPVRRVQVETAKFQTKSGVVAEGQRELLEVTTYNLKGQRVDNASYLVGSSSGKEEYKYDEKGHIIEMTLRGDDGSIVSRETYQYEIDSVGNWTKMITSLVLFENGALRSEPVEVTYRTITYYYDQTIAKMIETPSSPASPTLNAASASVETDPTTLAKSPVAPAEPSASPDAVAESSQADAKPLAPATTSDSPQGSQVANPADSVNKSSKEELALNVSHVTETNVAPVTEVPTSVTAAPPSNHKAAVDLYKNGRAQFDKGNVAGAIQAYQQSIQLEPGIADVYLSLGHAYLRQNKNKEAATAFKESVRLNPNLEEAHYGLGLDYFRMGNMNDAAQAFKKAIRARPDMVKAHYGLALAYQEMQKLDLLMQEYRILEILEPNLAKKLADSFPQFNLPCGGRRCH